MNGLDGDDGIMTGVFAAARLMGVDVQLHAFMAIVHMVQQV